MSFDSVFSLSEPVCALGSAPLMLVCSLISFDVYVAMRMGIFLTEGFMWVELGLLMGLIGDCY